ncbi:amidohydrolase [Devosia sp.]|uniref:amidohydrolase family protein n=1 Tax=Devosia sp. TaxID=1871048 RepID=UPI00273344EF|nr:amidohydrolase family protein [Devosia sp.]MDP2779621.1 amidohydrolase family protein [Devosia sp.]
MSIEHEEMAVPLVDAHAHVFKRDMPLRDNPRHAPDYDFTLEDFIGVLDAHGVGQAVLAAASPWLDYNDYVIDCVRHSPRLRGTVILEPSVERIVMQDMDRAGIVGVRMHLIGLDRLPDLSTFEYRRTFRRIADLDWHIHLHADGKDLVDLLPVFEACGAKLVVDHLGRPTPEDGVDCAGFKAMMRSIEKGRTWVKASGPHRLGFKESAGYLKELLRQTGDTRIVWGSDCPFVGTEGTRYQETIDWFQDAVPDLAAQHRIGGLNALELYFGASKVSVVA